MRVIPRREPRSVNPFYSDAAFRRNLPALRAAAKLYASIDRAVGRRKPIHSNRRYYRIDAANVSFLEPILK